MKLLLKQELDLRQQTRSELLRNPTEKLKADQLSDRCSYLQSQLQHSFHITEQMSIALNDQLETIYSARKTIKQLQDELSYSKAYVRTRVDSLKDDLEHVFEADADYQ